MEGFDIRYQGQTVGRVTVRQAAGGVRFDAVCTLDGSPVLRLCGGRNGRTLPIGVLAPHAGYWHIGRTLTRQTLREAGFGDSLPDAYWLSDRAAPPEATGDPLLDAALLAGTAALRRTENGLEVSCPFDPAQPSALAFALPACTVENGRAVLRLRTERGAL